MFSMDLGVHFLDISDMETLWHPDRLRLVSHGEVACPPEWHWRTDAGMHDDLDLWVVLAGRGRVETPHGDFTVSRGSCLILRGGEAYRGSQDLRDRLVVSYSHFDRLDATGARIPAMADPPPFQRQVPDPGLLEALLHRLDRAWHQAGDGRASRFWLAAALNEVAVVDASPPGNPDADLDDLADRIRRDPGAWPDVAAMARHLACTPDHCARRWRRHFAISPGAALTQARLDRARDLLRSSELSVAAVGRAVGYDDPAYFSRVFTRKNGAAPSAWRKGS